MKSSWDQIKAKGSQTNLHGQKRLAFLEAEQMLIKKALDDFDAAVEKAFRDGFKAAEESLTVKVAFQTADAAWNQSHMKGQYVRTIVETVQRP